MPSGGGGDRMRLGVFEDSEGGKGGRDENSVKDEVAFLPPPDPQAAWGPVGTGGFEALAIYM
jgi:hypothetical protein